MSRERPNVVHLLFHTYLNYCALSLQVKDGEPEEVAAPQHEEWVDFQKSISVSGFQTGQTTKARVQQKGEIGQKLRDLKRREKIEMRLAAKRPDAVDVSAK